MMHFIKFRFLDITVAYNPNRVLSKRREKIKLSFEFLFVYKGNANKVSLIKAKKR